jgi:hypothetical protein
VLFLSLPAVALASPLNAASDPDASRKRVAENRAGSQRQARPLAAGRAGKGAGTDRGLKCRGRMSDSRVMSLTDQMELARRTRTAIEELIADPAQLGPEFEAIHDLNDGSLLGYKATGRGKPGTSVDDTLSLLAGAQSLGLVERLDWAFRCHAFDVAMREGLAGELHITPEPETFGSACPPRLAMSWARGRRQLNVVAELHEDAFGDEQALAVGLAEMRGWGWRFALTDLSGTALGDAGRAATLLELVQPAYVHLNVRTDASGRGIAWAAAAKSAAVPVIAVGVDSSSARRRAASAGARYARGTAALLGPSAT